MEKRSQHNTELPVSDKSYIKTPPPRGRWWGAFINSNPKYGEFVRFCIVGVIATALDAGIFYLVRLFASYQVALVSGYCLSLIVNYLLTIYWTFKKKPSTGNLFGVIAAHMFNLFVVRFSLMWIFVNLAEIPDRIAYIPTLMISMVTNFLVVRFAVNKTEKKETK